jgi:hypothetical protein
MFDVSTGEKSTDLDLEALPKPDVKVRQHVRDAEK